MVEGAGVPTGTPLTDPPVIEMISEDPVLRSCKLIAEAWDCDGLNQVGAFPHYGGQWAEWNGHFRDTVRQFIKVQCMNCLTHILVCICDHGQRKSRLVCGMESEKPIDGVNCRSWSES